MLDNLRSSSKISLVLNIIRLIHLILVRSLGTFLVTIFAARYLFYQNKQITVSSIILFFIIGLAISTLWALIDVFTREPILFRHFSRYDKENGLKGRIVFLFLIILFQYNVRKYTVFNSTDQDSVVLMFRIFCYLLSYMMMTIPITTILIYTKNTATAAPAEHHDPGNPNGPNKGEKNVQYVLEKLRGNYIVINSITLKGTGEKQQFDHIVIGECGIFNIETKYYEGTITIDNNGGWKRKKSVFDVEGLENPIFQASRHHDVLADITENRVPVIDLIVLAHPNCILKGAENNPVKVIKYDLLKHYIESCKPEIRKLSIDEIKDIERIIKDHIAADRVYDN